MYRQSQKNLLNSNISSTCSHNMVNVGPLTADTGWRLWGTPANFNGVRVLASLLQLSVAQRKSTKLCTTFGRLLGWYTIYNFSEAYARNAILPCAIFTLRPSRVFLFSQRYCTALEQWALAKLCSIVQGMGLWKFRSSSFSTEEATYIPRAAIRLGIGPHSSCL